jgi:hypothetical protein
MVTSLLPNIVNNQPKRFLHNPFRHACAGPGTHQLTSALSTQPDMMHPLVRVGE